MAAEAKCPHWASIGACTSPDLDVAGLARHEPLQRVLADDRPRNFDQRHQRIERAAAELIDRPSAKIPKRPSATIAGGVAEANHER